MSPDAYIAECARLTQENEELRAKLYALRALAQMPHAIVEHTIKGWHTLLDEQDAMRPRDELPNFSVFKKD
jgi:hypothetical protein